MVAAALVVTAGLCACGGGHAAKSSTTTGSTRAASSPPSTSVTTTATTAATATTGSPPAADAYWPYEKLVASLAGRTLALPRGPVRLDSALLECIGEGAPVRTGPTRRWRRYTCTQTLFQGGVDRDVTFDVTILGAAQLTITSERYGPE
jgi:hypothetical protein